MRKLRKRIYASVYYRLCWIYRGIIYSTHEIDNTPLNKIAKESPLLGTVVKIRTADKTNKYNVISKRLCVKLSRIEKKKLKGTVRKNNKRTHISTISERPPSISVKNLPRVDQSSNLSERLQSLENYLTTGNLEMVQPNIFRPVKE